MKSLYNFLTYSLAFLVCISGVAPLGARVAHNLARRKAYGIALKAHQQRGRSTKRSSQSRRQNGRKPLSRQALRRSTIKKNVAQNRAAFARNRAAQQATLARNYTNRAINARNRAQQHNNQAQEARAAAQRATNELTLCKKHSQTYKDIEQRIAQATQKAAQEERARVLAQAEREKAALEAQRHALAQQLAQVQTQVATNQARYAREIHDLKMAAQLQQGRLSSLETEPKRTAAQTQETQELKHQITEMLNHINALNTKLAYGQAQFDNLQQEYTKLREAKAESPKALRDQFTQTAEFTQNAQNELEQEEAHEQTAYKTSQAALEQAKQAAQQAAQIADASPEALLDAQIKLTEYKDAFEQVAQKTTDSNCLEDNQAEIHRLSEKLKAADDNYEQVKPEVIIPEQQDLDTSNSTDSELPAEPILEEIITPVQSESEPVTDAEATIVMQPVVIPNVSLEQQAQVQPIELEVMLPAQQDLDTSNSPDSTLPATPILEEIITPVQSKSEPATEPKATIVIQPVVIPNVSLEQQAQVQHVEPAVILPEQQNLDTSNSDDEEELVIHRIQVDKQQPVISEEPALEEIRTPVQSESATDPEATIVIQPMVLPSATPEQQPQDDDKEPVTPISNSNGNGSAKKELEPVYFNIREKQLTLTDAGFDAWLLSRTDQQIKSDAGLLSVQLNKDSALKTLEGAERRGKRLAPFTNKIKTGTPELAEKAIKLLEKSLNLPETLSIDDERLSELRGLKNQVAAYNSFIEQEKNKSARQATQVSQEEGLDLADEKESISAPVVDPNATQPAAQAQTEAPQEKYVALEGIIKPDEANNNSNGLGTALTEEDRKVDDILRTATDDQQQIQKPTVLGRAWNWAKSKLANATKSAPVLPSKDTNNSDSEDPNRELKFEADKL
ncbi:hypothetical protein H0X48_05815 [Candidatus Dependentiae bacterium]|nr:hypothetical protein [Candidatus Dependentiae bacterium]